MNSTIREQTPKKPTPVKRNLSKRTAGGGGAGGGITYYGGAGDRAASGGTGDGITSGGAGGGITSSSAANGGASDGTVNTGTVNAGTACALSKKRRAFPAVCAALLSAIYALTAPSSAAAAASFAAAIPSTAAAASFAAAVPSTAAPVSSAAAIPSAAAITSTAAPVSSASASSSATAAVPSAAAARPRSGSSAMSFAQLSSKTKLTQDCEAEIKILQAAEREIKTEIKNATINRTKALAAKRAELKAARAVRDKKIKAEIEALKTKKDKQTAIVRSLKKALSVAKKLKNGLAIAAAEAACSLAEIELGKTDIEYKEVKNKLSDSYKRYKVQYDNLTESDRVLRADQLAKADAEKQNLSALRDDYKAANKEYKDSLRAKDFISAQSLAREAVAAQERINASQSKILEHTKKFKEQYTAGIVNRPVS